MLQLPIIALFLRTIPEGIVLVAVAYMILNSSLNIKKICIAGGILGIAIYLIRMLPIHFGVHIMLNLIIHIFLIHKLINIDLYKAVTTSIISLVLLITSESIIIIFYKNILNLSSKIIFDQTIISILLGLPALVLLFLEGMLIKGFINFKRNKEI